jgi:hypothetical protein
VFIFSHELDEAKDKIKLNITVFWNVEQCILVLLEECIASVFRVQESSILKTEAAGSSEEFSTLMETASLPQTIKPSLLSPRELQISGLG